jgi:photosystem II stability/assembly factor-like uncharacterized protein
MTHYAVQSMLVFYAAIALLLMPIDKAAAGGNVAWVRTSLNGPAMGAVVSLAQLPTGELLAGTYKSLFLSSDNGSTWTERASGLSPGPVFSISFDPNGTIYIASNNQIFRSSSKGATWELVPTGYSDWSFAGVNCVGCSPTGTLLAGTGGRGILKSTDNGASWHWTMSGYGNTIILHFFFDSTGGVYAAPSAGYDGHRLYRSTDDGTTWNPVSDGWDDAKSFACRATGVIYMGTGNSGILRSTNYGSSWEPLNTGLDIVGVYGLALAGDDTMFAAGTCYPSPVFFRSTDAGANWEAMGSGLNETYAWCLLQATSGVLFVGTETGGAYRSQDRAEHWTSVSSGKTGRVIRSLIATSSGVLVVGTEGDGIFLTSDQGNTWYEPASAIGCDTVWSLARDSTGNLFASTPRGIFRSSDGGQYWVIMYSYPADEYKVYYSYLTVGYDGKLFAAVGDGYGLLKSTDEGISWEGLANAPFVGPIALTRQNVILLGGGYDPIHTSTDGGITWLGPDAGSPASPRDIFCFAVDPAGNVFAGGAVNSLPMCGLFKSTDEGRRWNITSIDSYCHALAVNSRGELFAGVESNGGIFRSTDAGSTWDAVGPLSPTALAVDGQGFLFAGGSGGNLYRTIQSTTGIASGRANKPMSFALEQNYPNPFNPTTSIGYSVGAISSQQTAVSSHVRLAVYDLLGREVAVLVDEKKAPGNYQVEFDGGKLASGVYFYRLTAGDHVESKRMILLR